MTSVDDGVASVLLGILSWVMLPAAFVVGYRVRRGWVVAIPWAVAVVVAVIVVATGGCEGIACVVFLFAMIVTAALWSGAAIGGIIVGKRRDSPASS